MAGEINNLISQMGRDAFWKIVNPGYAAQSFLDENDAPGVGEILNELTGVNASNAFNSAQAQAQRDFERQERIESQEFNSAEALAAWERTEESNRRAREWSEIMENSAVQRRMDDLRKAGLNPMVVAGNGLAAGSDAASGSTSSAASVSPSSGVAAHSSGNSAAAIAAILFAVTKIVGLAKAPAVAGSANVGKDLYYAYGGE